MLQKILESLLNYTFLNMKTTYQVLEFNLQNKDSYFVTAVVKVTTKRVFRKPVSKYVNYYRTIGNLWREVSTNIPAAIELSVILTQCESNYAS